MITLIESSSIAPACVAQVKALVRAGETALVILDSNHTRAHVRAELDAYADVVAVGSYLVATDGVMRDLADLPRGDPRWTEDNPYEAARDFAAADPRFVLEEPPRAFDDAETRGRVTYWPGAFLRRVR